MPMGRLEATLATSTWCDIKLRSIGNGILPVPTIHGQELGTVSKTVVFSSMLDTTYLQTHDCGLTTALSLRLWQNTT